MTVIHHCCVTAHNQDKKPMRIFIAYALLSICDTQTYRFLVDKVKVALVPPNPKLLESAVSIFT